MNVGTHSAFAIKTTLFFNYLSPLPQLLVISYWSFHDSICHEIKEMVFWWQRALS